jgi:hypothetical protein
MINDQQMLDCHLPPTSHFEHKQSMINSVLLANHCQSQHLFYFELVSGLKLIDGLEMSFILFIPFLPTF